MKTSRIVAQAICMMVAGTMLLMVVPKAAAWNSSEPLTFNGLQNNEPIENYYNGGTGGDGSGPGPNYGVTFQANGLALVSLYSGGSGNFLPYNGTSTGDPVPGSSTSAYFLTGSGDIMNVAGGFTGGFSFYYTAIYDPGTVTVWSGLNGTGTLLASLSLAVTPWQGDTGPSGQELFDNWVEEGIAFAGTAESVNFSGTANEIGFDYITAAPSTSVPDATGISAELLAGLGMIGSALRLRRKAAATV